LVHSRFCAPTGLAMAVDVARGFARLITAGAPLQAPVRNFPYAEISAFVPVAYGGQEH
jgi:hypothetical protein